MPSKLNEKLKQSLSLIDGAMASLDAYPNLDDALLSKAQDLANKYLGKLFPTQLDFAKEILEHLVGTDVMIDIVSKFLTAALPEVEIALKAALLANMANLVSGCTIDPIIYEKAIKEGIIFDLRQIDLIDKLSVSPLDKKLGQYYYFGVDGCESAYDILQSAISPMNEGDDTKKVKKSYIGTALTNSVGHYFGGRKRDFDCLLWYMKNKAAYREVWGKRTIVSEDIFNGGNDPRAWLKQKGNKKSTYYLCDGNTVMFYRYKDGGWVEETDTSNQGSAVGFEKNKTYTFLDGGSYYTYKYGNPTIKKVSRKKIYLTDRENNQFYEYKKGDSDNTSKWEAVTATDISYNSFNDLPTTIKVGDTFYMGGTLHRVTSVKQKTKTVTDKDGNKQEIRYVGVDTDIAINATIDIKNNLCLYVDYEEGDNKEKIKEGGDKLKELTVAFGTTYDEVLKNWTKEKDDKASSEVITDTTATTSQTTPLVSQNLYYEDTDDSKSFDSSVDKMLIAPHEIKSTKKGKKKATKCINVGDEMGDTYKYTKDFGVVTLEYSPRTGNLKQSDGNPLQQQTPYDNVLHVFMGNVKELPDSQRSAIEEDVQECSNLNKLGVNLYNKIYSALQGILEEWKAKTKEWKKQDKEENKKAKKDGNATNTESEAKKERLQQNKNYRNLYNSLNSILYGGSTSGVLSQLTAEHDAFNNITELEKIIKGLDTFTNSYFNKQDGDTYRSPNSVLLTEEGLQEFLSGLSKDYLSTENQLYSILAFIKRAAQLLEANENLYYLSASNLKYPDAQQNYYLKHTLLEFNTDYVNSLQLFDAKVLAAQIITSLFGGVSLSAMLGATASWKTELIRDTVKTMVEKAIAAQDYTVSDCFFTFTNDAYNGMLRATELRQAGLYSKHGEENGNNKVDPISLLNGLNQLDDAADLSEQQSIIKGTLLNVSAEISKDTYTESNSLGINADLSVQVSFVETLITNLCTQLVMAMLSPKVYLLILINLHMFGLTTSFDLKSFIQNFSNLIMSIVNSVVEKYMSYMSTYIMELVEDLVSKLAQKLALEQIEMYMRLLKQIIEHFRQLTKCDEGSGWTQDVVTSADIIESDVTETINEC